MVIVSGILKKLVQLNSRFELETEIGGGVFIQYFTFKPK